MRATLGADRSREHLEAHARGDTITHCHLRAEDVVHYATRGGAHALGLDHAIGSLEPGKKADLILIKNDHTDIVNGRILQHNPQLTAPTALTRARAATDNTTSYLKAQLGHDNWTTGMHPDVPPTATHENPYTYTR